MITKRIPGRLAIGCGLLLQVLFSTSSHAADTVPTMIGQLEEQLNTALVGCDAVALARIWDDKLVFVFPNGNVSTKAARISGLKRCTPGSPNSTNEAVDVNVYGDTAIAIVLSRWTGVADSKPFTSLFRATHVWVKRGQRWTLAAAHVSQIKE